MPAGAVGTLVGVWKAIAERFNFFSSKYTRWGKLLGEMVAKWRACPLNSFTNQTELDLLDQSLGTEDLAAQYYSKIADAKHTGKDGLPGEVCDVEAPGLPRAKGCRLGKMRKNMPKPLHEEEYLRICGRNIRVYWVMKG